MADPVTALVMMGVSTGFQMIGSIAQGNAAAAAAKTEAQNIETQRTIVRQQGSERANRVRAQARAILSEQYAQMGESGLVSGTGTSRDFIKGSAAAGELDAMTTQYESDMEALGLTQQAEQARARAKSARTQGYIGAASAAFGFGKSYSDYKSRQTAAGA